MTFSVWPADDERWKQGAGSLESENKAPSPQPSPVGEGVEPSLSWTEKQ